LVSRDPRFVFKPLLYDLLTDEVDPADIAPRLSRVLAGSGVTCIEAEVRSIRLDGLSACVCEDGRERTLEGDALVLALGAEANFYGLPGLEELALTAHTLGDFHRLRVHLETTMTAAAVADDPARAGQLRRVAVIGAGPSGVEIACKIRDMPLACRPEISIIEAAGDILRGFSEHMKEEAHAELQRRGIALRLGMPVSGADADGLRLMHEHFSAGTIIWTAGQRPVEVIRALAIGHEPQGRLVVGATLELREHPGVFSLGDHTRCVVEGAEAPPETAQVAVQQASIVARNVAARLRGRTLDSFRYLPLAETLTLGRRYDVFRLLGVQLSGELGYFVRRFVYMTRMPGWRHRAELALRWGGRVAGHLMARARALTGGGPGA
jgi:NADH dehydrogenase